MRADIKLYNQDCMEAMKSMKDNEFDLAIVDPPYGIGYEDGGQYFNKNKGKKWDIAPSELYFKELQRVSKEQIIWGGNYFDLPPTRCIIAWTKTNEIQEKTFSEWEMAWTSFKSPARYIEFKPFQRKGTRIHPCQKPYQLYKWLLKNYAKEGDKILDTHLGSGSIAIACWDLGFDLTGYEIDKDYYKSAVDRLERHKAQMQLF